LPEINTRYGRMIVPDVAEDIVGAFLARYGEWAEFEIRFIADNLEEGDRVADIGAFLGSFGIGLSHKKQLEKLCFVEPNPLVVEALRGNVTSNCRAPCHVVEALLCPQNYKPALAHRVGNNQGSTSYAVETSNDIVDEASSPVARMDFRSLWENHGPFNLIKLDVEGMELPILEDAQEYLKDDGVTAWVECNDDPASLRVAEFLLSCGLNLYYFAFPSFNPENFHADQIPQFPFAYEAGLFATRGEPKIDQGLLGLGCILKPVKDCEALRRAMWQTPRWIPFQIVCDRAEETIALAVHALAGDRYQTYLTSDSAADANAENEWAPVADLMDKVRKLEDRIREQEVRVREQEVQISEQGVRVREQEVQVRGLEGQLKERDVRLHQQMELIKWTEALARDRLKLLRAEKKQRLQAEKRYQEIILSSSWRATKPLRSFLTRAPRVRGYLKLSARALIRGLRRR
jgi:FkbM family methyltransferase